ncbi:MAG TPA: response regulator transcription factor [Blastocatellia bacterium]|jgi:DNA-binding NarL/FixJ family response regulator
MTNEIRVLIADDHPLVCKALRDALAEDSSVQIVAEAANGQMALEQIEQLRPAVAVLDIHMPRLGGLAVARAVHGRQLPTQIIILTGDEEPELLQAALNAGVKGYISKDNAIVEIVAGVKAVAAGKLFILTGSAESPSSSAGNSALKDLTPAERQILQLIAEGKSSKEIADTMHINYRTVDNHRTHISQKLGLQGSHTLLRFALEHKNDLR